MKYKKLSSNQGVCKADSFEYGICKRSPKCIDKPKGLSINTHKLYSINFASNVGLSHFISSFEFTYKLNEALRAS